MLSLGKPHCWRTCSSKSSGPGMFLWQENSSNYVMEMMTEIIADRSIRYREKKKAKRKSSRKTTRRELEDQNRMSTLAMWLRKYIVKQWCKAESSGYWANEDNVGWGKSITPLGHLDLWEMNGRPEMIPATTLERCETYQLVQRWWNRRSSDLHGDKINIKSMMWRRYMCTPSILKYMYMYWANWLQERLCQANLSSLHVRQWSNRYCKCEINHARCRANTTTNFGSVFRAGSNHESITMYENPLYQATTHP